MSPRTQGPSRRRPSPTAKKLFGKFGKDLKISGGWTLHGQQDSVSGASQLYNDQNLTGQDYRSAGVGALQQTMDMTIQGRVLNAFDVNAHLSNSRYGNSFNQAFAFNYKQKGTTLDLGNVNATLTGNELVPFSRSVQGIIFGRDFGNHTTSTNFATITRATTQHGSFVGQGTAGPYYMNASAIIPGSEHVQLNGKDLSAGKDYSIDYNVGQISFLGGLIVNQTDTVQYSYESQTYNTTPGLLAGTRVTTQSKGGDAVGFTLIKQKAVGVSSNRDGTVTQYFPVYGVASSIGGTADPQYKYYLSSSIDNSDPNHPLTLKWQNELLTLNVDYVLNTELHYFQLRKALPADTSNTGIASLSCTYKPVLIQSNYGSDKQVYGLDTHLKLSPNSSILLNWAGSQAEAASQTGSGMSLGFSMHSPSSVKKNTWEFATTLKDIGANFSSIDSTSTAFLQAQKGLNTSLRFTPNSFYNLTTSFSDSRVATTTGVSTLLGGTTATNANSTSWARNQGMNAALNVTLPHLPTMELTHSQTTQSSTGSLGHSSFSTDGLTSSWTKGFMTLSGGLTSTNSQGVSIFSSQANNSVATTTTTTGTLIDQANNGTFSQTVSNASALTSRLSLALVPAPWIGFQSDVGVSRNRTGSTATTTTGSSSLSTAHNFGWGFNLQPMQRMTLRWSSTNSTNGQSTAAFSNAATASAAAGTSVVSSQLTNVISGQETRSNTLSFQYSPVEWLTANLSHNSQLSLIPGSDNSSSVSTTMGLTGNPIHQLQLGLLTTQERVAYVGGEGSSKNQSTTATATAGPFGKMTFSTALMRMNYGSATYTTTAASSTGSSLAGSLGGLTGSAGSLGTTTTGLLQQGLSTTLSFETQYAIGGTRSLFARYRLLNQGTPGGSIATATNSVVGGSSSAYVSSNYKQGTGTVGLDMKLTEVVGFTLNFNLINMNDLDNHAASYHARSITTDLSARF